MDRQIIKAYDKQGNIHKILRVYTDDNLNISFKQYEKEEFKIESWNETIERNIEKFYCKKHLMLELNIDKQQWDKYIEDF